MKIKHTYETECYISESGYYTIKQEGEAIVLLSPEQLRLIMSDMNQAIQCADDWWTVEYQKGA